jgi:Diacylglycerol acyltransferase
MWYTALLIFDIFLWYIFSSLLLFWFPFHPVVDLLLSYNIPASFVALILLLPHFSLAGLYFFFSPPSESEWFRSLSAWEWMRKIYFSITVEYPKQPERKERDESKRGQTIYAIAPHGVYGAGTIMYFVLNPLYLRCVAAGTRLLSWIPIAREVCALSGYVNAHRYLMVEQLNKKRSMVLIPEGMRGLLHIHEKEGSLEVIERKERPRKGFIAAAMESKHAKDISIVPVYIEGQRETYRVYFVWKWFQQRMLERFGYPWPIVAFGHWGSFWPRPVKLTVKMGKEIRLKEFQHIDQVFEAYVNELKSLL